MHMVTVFEHVNTYMLVRAFSQQLAHVLGDMSINSNVPLKYNGTTTTNESSIAQNVNSLHDMQQVGMTAIITQWATIYKEFYDKMKVQFANQIDSNGFIEIMRYLYQYYQLFDKIMLHQYVYAMLAFATLGVLVPFFYYNVFGNAKHGRKIFMGDTGSLTIGMMLCFLSLKLTMCGLDDNTGNVHPMVLAFSPLLVPCCDVVRVYLHRVRNGKNPFLPDKNHIHHKLLALGIKQRNTMIIIVSVSTIFILLNILLSLYLNVNWIVLGDILIWTLANIRLTKSIAQLQSEQKTNK